MINKIKKILREDIFSNDKIYYHGGDLEITEFTYDVDKKNRTNNVAGFYFTDRKEKAQSYGSKLTQAHLLIKNPYILGTSIPNTDMAMQFKKELVIANPHLDKYDDWFNEKIQYLFQYNKLPFTGMDGMGEQRIYLAGGFDAIKDGDEIAVFNSKDIKVIPNLSENIKSVNNILRETLRETLRDNLKTDNKLTLPKIPTNKIYKNPIGNISNYYRVVNKIDFDDLSAMSKEKVNVEDIVPTQINLNINNLKSTENISRETEAVLLAVDGKYYVLDGHHRIANRILNGDSKIFARVVKINNEVELSENTRTSINFLLKENLNKNFVYSFLLDFGFLITMNLAKVSDLSKNEDSKKELNSMLLNLRKPIINGKTYSELIKTDEIVSNPKMLSALFSQIREFITYIEPRIKQMVIDGDKKASWVSKIENLKERYKKIVS